MKKLPTDTTDKFKDEYLNGMTVIDIGRKYGCNQVTVSKYLKKLNIAIAPVLPAVLKYSCDVDFFKTVDTEEKAYWLGFILAEGWLSAETDHRPDRKARTAHRMGIELSEVDSLHLELFKATVKSEAKISHRTRQGKTQLIHLCRIRIGDEQFCANLAQHTGVGEKSRTLKMPVISERLKPHLIRGFFDGEGCVYLSKDGKKTMISITSNAKAFLEEIAAELNLRGIPSSIYKYKHDDCYKLIISRRSSILALYTFLYENSTIQLSRQRLKFEVLRHSIG